MKKIVGILIFLLAIFIGSYFATGWLTEKELQKNVRLVNQSNELHVELLNYKRGWFQSNAVISWKVRIPARITKDNNDQIITIPAQDHSGSVPIEINHGPIIYNKSEILFGLGSANIHVTVPKEYDDYFNKQYSKNSTKPTLDLNIFVNYLANTQFLINIPEFKLINNQQQLIWSGMNSEVTLSPKLNKIIAKMDLKGLTFVQDNKKIVLNKINSDCDLKYTSNGLYIGEAKIKLPSILVTENNQTVMQISQLEVKSDSNVEKSLFNSKLKIELDQLFTHGNNYGPAKLIFSLKNLDANTLAEINHKISNIQTASDSERQQIVLSLLPKIPSLLSKGAEVKLSDVKVNMPDGVIDGNISLSLPNDNIGNPFQLLQKIQGDCVIHVSSKVLKNIIQSSLKQKINENIQLQQATNNTITPKSENEVNQQAQQQTDDKIQQLIKSGVLVEKNGIYSLEAKLVDGHLTVNGKEFTPSMLQI